MEGLAPMPLNSTASASPRKSPSRFRADEWRELEKFASHQCGINDIGVEYLKHFEGEMQAVISLIVDSITETLVDVSRDGTNEPGTFPVDMPAWMHHYFPTLIPRNVLIDVIHRLAGDSITRDGIEHLFDEALDRIESAAYDRRVHALRGIPYKDYLQSDHWQRVRECALEEADYRCRLCNSDKSLHVHHRTYERRGEEEPGDVIVLCADCHQHFHDKLKVVK